MISYPDCIHVEVSRFLWVARPFLCAQVFTRDIITMTNYTTNGCESDGIQHEVVINA